MYGITRTLKNVIIPELQNSQYIYYQELKRLLNRKMLWLDVGCGHQVFGEWMMPQQQEVIASVQGVVGIDLTLDSLRRHQGFLNKVLGGAGDLPFRGNSFDIVTANMVVEHVPDPFPILKEIYRVLRPGGLFIFHTANSGNIIVKIASRTPNAVKRKIVFLLDGRREDDIFETCYRFNAPDVIRAQAASAGYETISVQQVNSSAFTGILGPLALFELLYLRLLRRPSLAHRRSNIIGLLRRPRIEEGDSAT